MVKELRERTGAGMMECKKALVESDGDMDVAVENLRKAGAAKADKKAGRVAAEGVIAIKPSSDGKQIAMLEVNCETDFVASDDNFTQFVDSVIAQVLGSDVNDVDALSELPVEDGSSTTIAKAREDLVGKIGENIQVRRFQRIPVKGTASVYQHGSRIGVVVDLEGGDKELGKDIAMHIAASRPICVNEGEVPQDVLDKEKEIFMAQAKESGKPDNIIEKMVEGKMRKFLSEVTLLGQQFVKDPDTQVGKLLKSKNASVAKFVRFEVGEGIEKKQENFADEVMAQVKNP
jgi:elongation factor Ts